LVTGIFAQSIDPGTQSFLYPQRMRSGQFKNIIGLSMANLPEDVIESDDIFYAPLFAYYMRLGLPENFLMEASVNSNLITYHLSLGAKWTCTIDKFSFAPGYDVAFWFGGLRHFGFNSKVRGWIHYPNLTFGYEFNKFTISVKSELILVTFLKEFQDDLVIARDRNFYSGFAITTVIEQPLWSDNFLLIGLKINYTKFYYPQWAAFSRFNRFFFIPELIVGFIL
jgi:hypothetical protein